MKALLQLSRHIIGSAFVAVLREVSLPFPSGSIIALVEPTGSGKSKFLRTLNRMNDRVSRVLSSGRRIGGRAESLGARYGC